MRVYNAAIKDRAFTYAIFFLFFFIHIIFCVWSAISPPLPFSNDWSHTGFMSAIKAIGSNTFTGVIFIIGACFWTLETLWSLWCLKMVSTKHTADRRPLTLALFIAWRNTAACHSNAKMAADLGELNCMHVAMEPSIHTADARKVSACHCPQNCVLAPQGSDSTVVPMA